MDKKFVTVRDVRKAAHAAAADRQTEFARPGFRDGHLLGFQDGCMWILDRIKAFDNSKGDGNEH